MEALQLLARGFSVALSVQNIGAALLGAVLGLIVGAMPGIGSLAGCALLLPITFGFDPTTAIIMLGAIYYANMYGGAFSAILINIPGDAPAIMTAMDGYPLTRQGRPGQALMAANLSSCIGGTIGMIDLGVPGTRPGNLRSELRPLRDVHDDAGGHDLHQLAGGREPPAGHHLHLPGHPAVHHGHRHRLRHDPL